MPARDLDQRSFDELAQQIALGGGFQLLVVLTHNPADAPGLAEALAWRTSALRGRSIDYLVLAPNPGLGIDALEAEILSPLLSASELRASIDPLVVLDLSRIGDSDMPMLARKTWLRFVSFVNIQRNALVRAFHGTLLTLLRPDFAPSFAGAAPDLWSIRSGSFELSSMAAHPPQIRLAGPVPRRIERAQGPTRPLHAPEAPAHELAHYLSNAFSHAELLRLAQSLLSDTAPSPSLSIRDMAAELDARLEERGRLLELFAELFLRFPQDSVRLRELAQRRGIELAPPSELAPDLESALGQMTERELSPLETQVGARVAQQQRGADPRTRARNLVEWAEKRNKTSELALAWLERHGLDEEASHVLKPLLDRDPKSAAEPALAWLECHDRTRDAQFVLVPMLRASSEVAAGAVPHALAWLEAHGLEPDARFVLAALLSLSSGASDGAVAYARAWLDVHGKRKDAQFVLAPLLARESDAG